MRWKIIIPIILLVLLCAAFGIYKAMNYVSHVAKIYPSPGEGADEKIREKILEGAGSSGVGAPSSLEGMLWGLYMKQDLILPREGGEFDIGVINNEGDGDFVLMLEKGETASPNKIEYEIMEPTFSLPSKGRKIIKVKAKTEIIGGWGYVMDVFPVRVSATKSGEYFREANVFIMVDTSG